MFRQINESLYFKVLCWMSAAWTIGCLILEMIFGSSFDFAFWMSDASILISFILVVKIIAKTTK